MTTRSRVLEDEMDRRGLSSDGPILRPPFPAPMPEMEGIVLRAEQIRSTIGRDCSLEESMLLAARGY
jgi:hypothetical protein